MTVSPRDSEFRKAVTLELMEARRISPVPDLYALVEEVGDLARALRQYREDRIAWPEVVAEAVQLAVMAQRVAVEGQPSIRDLAAGSRDAPPDEAADLLPGTISLWTIRAQPRRATTPCSAWRSAAMASSRRRRSRSPHRWTKHAG